MIRVFKTKDDATRRVQAFTFPVKVVPFEGFVRTGRCPKYQLVYVIQSGRGEFKGTHNYLTTANRWITGRLNDLI